MFKTRFEWKIERMKKGITLREIAVYGNFSEGLLSKYERNKRNMSKDKVELYRKYITEK